MPPDSSINNFPDSYNFSPDSSLQSSDVFVEEFPNLSNPMIVCNSCSEELLANKTLGIELALKELKKFLKTDVLIPIVFHLDGDEFCGEYFSGAFSYTIIEEYQADVCLFEIEKGIGNSIEDQVLSIHEVIHAWFFRRIKNYSLEEPFCKLTSFLLTNTQDCSWFKSTFSYPDRLMYDLCNLGMNRENLQKIYTTIGDNQVTIREFVNICSKILGTDTTWAFEKAGMEL